MNLKDIIDIVTAEQNVFEWFVSRMFCTTASPAQKYISLGSKTLDYKEKDHWKKVNYYIKRDVIAISDVDSVIPDANEVELWAKDMFADDVDAWSWMSNIENLRKLEREALHCTEQKRKWLALCKEFKIFVYGKKEGYTNVSAQTIHSWVILSDDLKGIAKFVTVDSKRKELKRRLAPSNPLFRNIKNMPGKSYLS